MCPPACVLGPESWLCTGDFGVPGSGQALGRGQSPSLAGREELSRAPEGPHVGLGVLSMHVLCPRADSSSSATHLDAEACWSLSSSSSGTQDLCAELHSHPLFSFHFEMETL